MRTKQYIKEINKFSSKLTKENQEKFDKILLKIRYSKINDNEAEEFSHHCLDLFLQAEEQNVDIENILGTTDLDSFCEEFINESWNNYSSWKKLYWKLSKIPLMLFVFTGIFEMLNGELIKSWFSGDLTFSVNVTISMVVNTLLTLLLASYLLSKTPKFYKILNSNNKKEDRKLTLCLWLLFCTLIGIFVLTKLYLNISLFKINYLAFMGILLIILLIQYFYENK